jgi:O-antigen/teichoic acid export membrane protein
MILRNISWLALGQVVRLVLGLLTGAWLTRTIGPAQNGLLGTAMVIGALTGFFADFGIRQVLIKELATHPDRAPILFGTAARISTLLGIVMFGVACLLSWLWGGDRMLVLGFVLGLPLFLNGWLTVLSRWDANHEAHRTAKLGLIANFISSAAKVVCVLTGANLVFAALTFALDNLIGALVALSWAAKRGWTKDLWHWDATFARSLLRDALPLFLSHCGTLLLLRIDQLMVFRIAGEGEAGIYAAATRLSEVVYAISPILTITFLPRLSESFKMNSLRYRRQCQLLFGTLTLIAYASVLSWWALGPWLVSWLYGSAFAAASNIILVHCIAALPYLHGELRNSLLVVEGKSYSGAKAALVGVVMNAGLNAWWIPTHGALGAAWATVVTYSLVWFGGSLIMPTLRHIGWHQLRSLLSPLWIWQPTQWQSFKYEPTATPRPLVVEPLHPL